MKFQKLTKSRLTDQVVEILYNKISHGELKPGDKLPSETELSEQLGVARPTIREALSRLLGLGLIERGDYTMSVAEDSKASVRARLVPLLLEQWETRELYEARMLIEGDLAVLASRKATPDDIMELREINKQLDNGNTEKDYWTCDMEFHARIAEISGSEVMVSISNIINDLYLRFEKEIGELHAIQEITYRDHEELICAIDRGDEVAIRAIVTRSLSGSENAIYELLQKDED